MKTRVAMIWLGLVFAAFSTATAQSQFDDLLRRIPPSANAVMVIDMNAVLSSPLAIREDWKNQHEAEYVKRPLMLPPEATRLVVAAEMIPAREFEQVWELAVMSLTEPFAMRAVARAEGGYVDEINGLSAAWTPSDAYFVSLEPNVLGVMSPGNRQAVSRWADAVKTNRTGAISPYLKSAAALAGQQTQIVLAMDLKDVVRPHALDEALRESPLAPKDAATLQAWKTIIMGIQGVTLRIELGEKAQGFLQVDFAASPQPFGSSAKDLLLEVLTNFGAGIEDLESWNASLESQSIVMRGELSKTGMRKLFSLLELPSAKFSTLKGEKPAPADDTETIAKASQRYYQSITTLLDDIRKEFATNRDARHGFAPTYMERYGRMIDRLPILNVDEELLVFGASVSETLRSMATAQRSGAIKGGVRKSQTYGAYSYSYDNNGYYNNRSTTSVHTQINREEQGKALIVRFNSWKEIEDNLADTRKKMTAKYRVDF